MSARPLGPSTRVRDPGTATVYRTPPADWHARAGEVHVFLFTLDADEDDTARCLELLSDDERERHDRFRTEKLRARFAVAHAVKRQLIGWQIGLPGERLRFGSHAQGKPYLRDMPSLCFNLSHSGAVGLLGLAIDRPLGVDIESLRELDDLEQLANRFFSADERAALAELPRADRPLAFFRCWVRKEAYLKAVGTGLHQPLDSFAVSVGSRATFISDGPDLHWSLRDVSPNTMLPAAVCATPGATTWQCWGLTRVVDISAR